MISDLAQYRELAKERILLSNGNEVLLFAVYSSQFIKNSQKDAMVMRAILQSGPSRNVFCYSPDGTLLWRIEKPINRPESELEAFVGIDLLDDGTIRGTTFAGFQYLIAQDTGILTLTNWSK